MCQALHMCIASFLLPRGTAIPISQSSERESNWPKATQQWGHIGTLGQLYPKDHAVCTTVHTHSQPSPTFPSRKLPKALLSLHQGPAQRHTDRLTECLGMSRQEDNPCSHDRWPAQVSSPTQHPMTNQQVTRIEPPGSAIIPANKWARAHPFLGPISFLGTPLVGLDILPPRPRELGSVTQLSGRGLSVPSDKMGTMTPSTWGCQL